MKPKISKRYVNYEEGVVSAHKRDLPPEEKLWTLILSTFVCGLVRFGLCVIMVAISYCIAYSLYQHVPIAGIIALIFLAIPIISGSFNWVQNRIYTWKIDYYIRREYFYKIWNNPKLADYVNSHRRELICMDSPQIIINWTGVHYIPSNLPIHWAKLGFYREWCDMTTRFILGFIEHDVKKYYLTNTIKYWLWELLYFAILCGSIIFEGTVIFGPSNYSTLIQFICWFYFIAHSTYTLGRIAINWTFVLTGTHINRTNGNLVEIIIHRWDWLGRPYNVNEGSSHPEYCWFAYKTSEESRFFLNIIRHFTII